MSAVSGPFRAHQWHPLREERHFALLDDVVFPTVGSLAIVLSLDCVRPSHPFGRNRDHDDYFELLRVEEQEAQSTHIAGMNGRYPWRV
jgi:hypothetical protein